MSTSTDQKAAGVLDQLLDLPDAERAAAAQRLCGNDPQLLARTMSLLSAMPLVDGFLSSKTLAPPDEAPMLEQPGTVIGRYKLLQQIGEGGFGVVFMAEQEKPVRRTVALKVIKLGMDTREVVARFEAERQALALMDHPNIAKVLDAGSTDTGRPYFVMELVRGSPITEYADKHKLSTIDRVALAAQVCRAVQHAHSKGVIHRDLKPTNVLVTVTDDKPVPKVIDFGIAKATQSKLTDKTLFTSYRQLIGTPQYMSPEQADSDGSDLDTRTDVYSLGVLIYELLVGTTPMDARELRSAAFEAMRKMIRDTNIPRPATRLHTLAAESQSAIAASRSTDVKKLTESVKGELDWIVMKSLEKDRTRRYETAAALADDLGRFLAGEAVLAGPVSGLYRFRKTLSRHRTELLVASVIALFIAVGAIGTTAALVRERTTRQESRAFAYRAAVNAAAIALRTGDGPRFAHEMAAAPADYRGWEWDWLTRAGTLHDRVRLEGNPGEKFTSASDPSNTRVCGYSDNGTVVMWDLTSGHVMWRQPALFAALNPIGSDMAIFRTDQSVDICDIDTGALRFKLPPPPRSGVKYLPYLSDRPFSADGKLFTIGFDKSPGITVVDLATGHATLINTADPADPHFLRDARPLNVGEAPRDPRGILYCSGQRSGDLLVELTPQITGSVVRECPKPLDADGWAIDPSCPLVNSIASGALDSMLPLHGIYAAYNDAVGGLVRVPLPEGVAGSTVKPRYTEQSLTTAVADLPVRKMSATPDESRFIQVLVDGSVWVLPIDPFERVVIPGFSTGLVLSPDGLRVITMDWGYVACLDPVTGLPLWARNIGETFCHSAAWSPDGSRVIVMADDEQGTTPSEAFVLDGQTGRPLETWSRSLLASDGNHPPGLATWAGTDVSSGLAFTRDGRFIRIGHLDGSVSRIDAVRWQSVNRTRPETLDPTPNTFLVRRSTTRSRLIPDPTGSRYVQVAVGGSFERELLTALIVRSDDDDHSLFVARLPGYAALSAAWTPDGRALVGGYAAPSDSCILMLDAKDGTQRWRTAVPDGSIPIQVLVTPDGSRVLAMTSSLMVVCDAQTGQVILAAKARDVPSGALMTADGAVLMNFSRSALIRDDLGDPEKHLSDVRRAWPAGLLPPVSVADARQQVAAVIPLLTRGPLEILNSNAPTDSAAAPLFTAIRRTAEPNINWLNSAALNITLDKHSSPSQLADAIRTWRLAAAIAPASLKIEANLGENLFINGQVAESFNPLSAALTLYQDRFHRRSADLELLRAIAAHAANDSSAKMLYQQAEDLASHTDDSDGSLKALREQARQTFAR